MSRISSPPLITALPRPATWRPCPPASPAPLGHDDRLDQAFAHRSLPWLLLDLRTPITFRGRRTIRKGAPADPRSDSAGHGPAHRRLDLVQAWDVEVARAAAEKGTGACRSITIWIGPLSALNACCPRAPAMSAPSCIADSCLVDHDQASESSSTASGRVGLERRSRAQSTTVRADPSFSSYVDKPGSETRPCGQRPRS